MPLHSNPATPPDSPITSLDVIVVIVLLALMAFATEWFLTLMLVAFLYLGLRRVLRTVKKPR